jgi:hypothetical protein
MVGNKPTIRSKRWVYGLAGALAVAGALLIGGATVSAQSGPSADCASTNVTNFGAQFFGTDDFGNRLLSTSPTTRVFPLPTALVPGTYAVEAVSYDGYPGRDTIPAQPNEQWYAEFLSSDGTVLATTGSTADVADLVLEATWAGSLGEVTLGSTATQIRTLHADPGGVSVNSIRPVCLGAEAVIELVPSTVTVNFVDEGGTPGTVGIVCNTGSESASGATVTVGLDALDPNTICDSSWPMDRGCAVSMSPHGIENAIVGDLLRVTIPSEGGVDVIIDVVCPAPSDTDPDPGADDSSTTVDEVTTVVGGQVETPADAAVPQPGTPAFTG